MNGKPLVRALHGAAKVHQAHAPHDTILFRLHYPAEYTGSDAERLSGMLPALTEQAPWPLAIIMPGINVGSDQYRWLAVSLAQEGIATITFDFVDEVMPNNIVLSPGLDLTAVAPDTYGSRPSATAIAPLLDALRRLEREGPITGLIDASRFVLIGHSAGGTVALENTKREWFPGLCGVITYGAHTMPALMLGHPEDTVLPILDDLPVLLISGTHDGVIRQSADRYKGGVEHDPVKATFDRAVSSHVLSRHVVIDGGSHMVMSHPGDSTTARGFLDADPSTESQALDGEVRCLIAGLSIAFTKAAVSKDPQRTNTKPLEAFAKNPRVSEWGRK
ncbi:MAG: hypothetical protein FJW09_04995 [Actinobacteria bacterium]|nr:hypothetical protein [Actinomycetota bacterium]